MSRRRDAQPWFMAAAVGLYLFTAEIGWTQPVVTGVEALRRFEQTFADVKDFTATIEADIDMERIRIPRMSATLFFKRPDKFRYTSPGFALFPREGMVLDPVMLRERYTPKLEGRDTINGRAALRMLLDARDPKNRLQHMTIWLDPESWTPVRMETTPYGSRKLRADFTYEQIQEKYWLPRSVTVQFQVAEEPDLGQPPGESARAAPRKGTMTVRYLEYEVNTGLSDDVFVEPKVPQEAPK